MQSVHLREYGVQATVNFDIFEVDGVDFRVNAVHAAGDTVIMKNEGAEASTDNGFTDEGNGYSLVLSSTEMEAARIVIYIIDQTATKVWLDKAIVIETYGHASAQHAFNLNTAIQNVNVASQDNIDFGAIQKSRIPTSTENRQEMDSNSVDFASLLAGQSAIFGNTNTDIPVLIAALKDLGADTILTESYAADGVEPTLEQILYMMWSMMNSLGFVLTVGTSRKLDGTTPSMTFAIDDADNPTDINRET